MWLLTIEKRKWELLPKSKSRKKRVEENLLILLASLIRKYFDKCLDIDEAFNIITPNIAVDALSDMKVNMWFWQREVL